MNTVLDPSLLFISEDAWNNESIRDLFLQQLLDNLNAINDYCITQIYWTDEIHELLWSDPQLPPWRLDRDWKLQIVPIINNLLMKNIINIEIDDVPDVCNCSPALSSNYGKSEIHICFLRLMHKVLHKGEAIFFCVGFENISPTSNYSFFCNCGYKRMEPILINCADDWLRYIDICDTYWPSCTDDKDSLKSALNLTRKISSDKPYLYNFDFDMKFIRSIIEEHRYRQEILSSISRRLLLNQKEASADKGLNDEPVKSKNNEERRFKVTRQNRIHYIYTGQRSILFMDYYGENEHDSGL